MTVKYEMGANDHIYNWKQMRRKGFFIKADVVAKVGSE